MARAMFWGHMRLTYHNGHSPSPSFISTLLFQGNHSKVSNLTNRTIKFYLFYHIPDQSYPTGSNGWLAFPRSVIRHTLCTHQHLIVSQQHDLTKSNHTWANTKVSVILLKNRAVPFVCSLFFADLKATSPGLCPTGVLSCSLCLVVTQNS